MLQDGVLRLNSDTKAGSILFFKHASSQRLLLLLPLLLLFLFLHRFLDSK